MFMVSCGEVVRAPIRRTRNYVDKNREYIRASGTLISVYFFSCTGDRLWSFSIGIFISKLGGLAWVALAQMFDSLIKLCLLPILGKFLDRTERFRGMQIILFCNNISIALSAISFYLSLSAFFDPVTNHILLIAACLFNAVSRVASEAQKAAFTKDWIVVIVEDSGVGKLSTHNSLCSAIDQFAAFLAPIASGLCIDYFKPPHTALIFMIWNLISWVAESLIIRDVYNKTPALQYKDTSPSKCCSDGVSESSAGSFTVYLRQHCLRAAFALALLFMTVLGFDNLAIAFGEERGVSAATLGYFRSAGALTGFLGVFAYKILDTRSVHIVTIGMIGLLLQNVFLQFTTASVFMPGNDFNTVEYFQNATVTSWWDDVYTMITRSDKPDPVPHSFSWLWENTPSLIFFFSGITLARFGLWMADCAITEILQESVPENERYRVNLMQNSLQEGFSFLKDALVVCFPLSITFGGLVMMSVSFVFSGFLLYATYFITEGTPCIRQRDRPDDVEMVPRIELKVKEPGVHPELADLLEKEAPLQTSRTDAL